VPRSRIAQPAVGRFRAVLDAPRPPQLDGLGFLASSVVGRVAFAHPTSDEIPDYLRWRLTQAGLPKDALRTIVDRGPSDEAQRNHAAFENPEGFNMNADFGSWLLGIISTVLSIVASRDVAGRRAMAAAELGARRSCRAAARPHRLPLCRSNPGAIGRGAMKRWFVRGAWTMLVARFSQKPDATARIFEDVASGARRPLLRLCYGS
jgi:hypothetical protein